MPAAYTRTCINAPPNNSPRCWWTFVPDAVKTNTNSTPIVIDMHGGGGCASMQAGFSGWKELSASLGADGFIVAWPQGSGNQWGSCGSDCAKVRDGSKAIHSVDDVTFLSDMIAYMAKSQSSTSVTKGLVDPEKVFLTGFSMGCMMSHRFAMEKSNITAGFGCHGGALIRDASVTFAADKTKYDIQPTPAYMTGGTADSWFDTSTEAYAAWSAYDNCGSAVVTSVTLTDPTTAARLSVSTAPAPPTPAVQVASLNMTGGTHTLDTRMANYTWQFLQRYKRTGAFAAMAAAPASVVPPVASSATTSTFELPRVLPMVAAVALLMAHRANF